jgi:hypothetical protein
MAGGARHEEAMKRWRLNREALSQLNRSLGDTREFEPGERVYALNPKVSRVAGTCGNGDIENGCVRSHAEMEN